MKPVVAQIGAGWLAAVLLFAGGASARDGGPEAGTTGDAGKSCASSDDCTRPAVHCHPARHECVECLSNRNCGFGLVCDVASGVCAGCASDGDCPVETPYCASGACVECRTDANCGNQGVVCSGGVCGSCGDGICHLGERLADRSGFNEIGGCPEDCASLCPTLTLELNEVRTVAPTRNLFELYCGDAIRTNDFTVTFTAPKEFNYRLKLRADEDDPSLTISPLTDCREANSGCALGEGLQRDGYEFEMIAGETVTFLIESTVHEFEVQIVEEGPIGPERDAGGPTEEETAECLANAAKRGDPTCGGVSCACGACPRAYDTCGEAEGCGDVVQCMHDKSCIGVDCYTTGACRRLIDTRGGVSGPAFRAATALQACTLSHLCTLPCAVADAGEALPPDAGPLCAPGRRVACSCEGGTGTKRCNESGTSFSECVCSPREVPEPASCDCRVGRRASFGELALLLSGLVVGLAGLRNGHASRRRR
jgi:hypothetical protein